MKKLFALMVVCSALVAVGCGEKKPATPPADAPATDEPATDPAAPADTPADTPAP